MNIEEHIFQKCFFDYQNTLQAVTKGQSEFELISKNSIDMEKNYYLVYPFHFSQYFKNIKESDLYHLTLCGNIFFTWIRLLDRVVDKHIQDSNVIQLWLLQENYTHNLFKLFPYNSEFWNAYEKFKMQTLWSHKAESEIQQRTPTDYETMLKIAKYKSAFAKCASAGLAALSDENDPFEESQDEFHCGLQLLDDLKDWKSDYNESKHSFVLNQIFKDEKIKNIVNNQCKNEQLNTIGRHIFLSGVAVQILTQAKEHFENALSLSIENDVPHWHSLLKRNISKCDDLIKYYSYEPDWIIKKRQRVKKIHSLTNATPYHIKEGSKFTDAIENGLKFVILEHQHGYPEMVHRLVLPDFEKPGGEVITLGNLFQRMIVLENMLDMKNNVEEGYFTNILISDLEDILQTRRTVLRGGWSYFPDYPWIPPDADSLAQMIKLLVKGGCITDFSTLIGDIELLVSHNRYENGTFRTWVLDPNDKSELATTVLRCVKKYWGEYFGSDIEITINVLLALSLYDRLKYKNEIEKGMCAIYQAQQPEGYWKSGWYSGNYYSTHLVMRLFALQDKVNHSVIDKIQKFLLNSQQEDGGWGSSKSDSLNTVFALSSLCCLSKYVTINEEIINKGVRFLLGRQKISGSWEAVKFICMPQAVVPFRSETITTSYVISFLSTFASNIKMNSRIQCSVK